MAESIKKVAQMAMDAFYQDFRPADGFMRLKHFEWLCIAADSKLKQDEYSNLINLRLRMRQFDTDITMSSDNYITVELPVVKEKVKLPYPVMTFSGDISMLGVRDVLPVNKCKPFIRLSPDEKWMACDIKDVVLWVAVCDTIELVNWEVCKADKVSVSFIPQLTDKSQVQESRKWAILNAVTTFIKAAKDGTIIDMTNDGNANVAQQTEINKYILKALKG
jgi:hypothetical protein